MLTLVAAEHVDHRSTKGYSELCHGNLQSYIMRESLAAFFDFVCLQDPACKNNVPFSAQAKANKVKALISFLDLLRAQPLNNAEVAKQELDAVYRWVLHYGSST